MNTSNTGRLLLVSTGIGEPDNLTLRAQRAIQQADLVVGLPGQCPRVENLLQDKQVLDAGHGLFTELARRNRSAAEVEEHEQQIQQQIRAAWAQGQTIVVLEMGDPCLFGPQAGYLQAFADLNPEVIPGISSFNAANALLARPLLKGKAHRLQLSGLDALECASQDGLPDSWVMFSMGLDMPAVIRRLEQLYPPETGIALIMDAGFNQQRLIEASLADLPTRLADAEIPWACLIYVGV
ncbi:MAG: SAM-dependent methyltransferase [Thiopseudomonas sp.]